jgi:hypothetical protein
MTRRARKPSWIAAALSAGLTLTALAVGLAHGDGLDLPILLHRLLWPLVRLMFWITVGLLAGQVIEATGWTRRLGAIAGPLFRFSNLGLRCSAAFATAFVSGVAANAMLLDFYKEGHVTRRQLFLTNFINHFPAYFLHLPTTFFVVISLTGWAGALYFLVTFTATVLRTAGLMVYGHLHPGMQNGPDEPVALPAPRTPASRAGGIWKGVAAKLPPRLMRIAVWVVPIYVLVFVCNTLGLFAALRNWLAAEIVTTFLPMEALSVVVLSFVAEFTSGFAAAGALLEAGVLTVKQTTMALLIGNVIAFPIRALRHQLPHYMGIYEPRMGTQLLLLGQLLRVGSLLLVGGAYVVLG